MTCNILRKKFSTVISCNMNLLSSRTQLNQVSMVLEMFSVTHNNFWNTFHNCIQKSLKFIILVTASFNEKKYGTMKHHDYHFWSYENDCNQHVVCIIHSLNSRLPWTHCCVHIIGVSISSQGLLKFITPHYDK